MTARARRFDLIRVCHVLLVEHAKDWKLITFFLVANF
jgi:hypothetical protein